MRWHDTPETPPTWRGLLDELNGGRIPDGVRRIRDPEFPCLEFDPLDGRGSFAPGDGRCDTDGHYLCRECRHISAEAAGAALTEGGVCFAMRSDVVALYVDPRGPYPRLVREWFDEARDARGYDGPLPVVAHPPCGPWGRLRHLSRHDDPALAIRAVEQVRAHGGVLEHPRGSLLWDACGMPRPGELPDAFGGITIQVDQVDWGHVARKTSWLYLVGVHAVGALPAKREPTHWISGGRGREGRKRSTTPVPPGIKVCSAQQRRRTPVAFAEWLLDLAASARREERAA